MNDVHKQVLTFLIQTISIILAIVFIITFNYFIVKQQNEKERKQKEVFQELVEKEAINVFRILQSNTGNDP